MNFAAYFLALANGREDVLDSMVEAHLRELMLDATLSNFREVLYHIVALIDEHGTDLGYDTKTLVLARAPYVRAIVGYMKMAENEGLLRPRLSIVGE